MKQTHLKLLAIILVIVALGSAYFAASKLIDLSHSYGTFDVAHMIVPPSAFSPRTTTTVRTSITAMPPSSAPAGWATYRNDTYGFEFKYPADFPFAVTDRAFPPSIFTLLGAKSGNPTAAFLEIVPPDGINLFPFSAKLVTSPTSLAELAAGFRARDNTKVVMVSLVVHVTVTDIRGAGGLAGVRTRVQSDAPPEGPPFVGVAYYFYKAPYFYRIISSVPGVDAEVSQIVSTFQFVK